MTARKLPARTAAMIERRRGIVANFDRDQVYLIGCALRAYGATLNAIDYQFPDPDHRAARDAAAALAEEFFQANQGRDTIERLR